MSDEITPGMPGGDPAPAAPEPVQEAPQVDPRAVQIWEGLNDLDRRPDVLSQVLKPGQDLPPGMDWNQARALLWQQSAQPQEEYDPFDQIYGPEPQVLGYDAQGQPVYDQPYQPQEQFDPRSLAPVFETYEQEITRKATEQAVQQVQQMMMQQAQDQALQTGIQQAAQQHQLTDFGKQVVESMTRNAQQAGDRRSPAEIAGAMAQQYLADANQRFVSQGGVAPVQGPAAPSGMIPGDSIPKTDAEAIAMSRSLLQRPS